MNQKYLQFLLIMLLVSIFACRPACHIASCHTRKVHQHGGKIYRGQPIWKKQNPNIGERLPKANKETQRSQHKSRKKQ